MNIKQYENQEEQRKNKKGEILLLGRRKLE